MRFVMLFIMCLIAGCTNLPFVNVQPNVSMPQIIDWNSQPEPNGAACWLEVCKTRWTNPVIFRCHGGTNGQGVWTCYPDAPRVPLPVEEVAWMLRNLYPRRDIILLVCNENGNKISVPNVWYGRTFVWSTDTTHDPWHVLIPRYHDKPVVGDIWEFVTAN
jgi:hypothetical protein